MVAVPLEDCLTMAAYSAMSAIHRCSTAHPELSTVECIDLLKKTDSAAFSLDYNRGQRLYEAVQLDIDWEDSPVGLRFVACEVVTMQNPWWLRLVPSGRDKVRSVLDIDQVRLLSHAGLFDPDPEPEVLAWWDTISASIRGQQESERMLLARAAERLSFEYEKVRLNKLGLDKMPTWVALDDNTLGYDIKSYDVVEGAVVSRLIEVKSASSDGIFVTRNEWGNAKTAHGSYFFHVWKMPDQELNEFTVTEMAENIPIDQKSGTWQNVRVVI